MNSKTSARVVGTGVLCSRSRDTSLTLSKGGSRAGNMLTPGKRLGPYEVISPLGAGGMGEVYKARDTRLDRTVAVKILPSADLEQRQRFEREARAIAALSHPNICTLHDIGHAAGTDFLVV